MIVSARERGRYREVVHVRCLAYSLAVSKPHIGASCYFYYDYIIVVGIWGCTQRDKEAIHTQPSLTAQRQLL